MCVQIDHNVDIDLQSTLSVFQKVLYDLSLF